jgi:hypothetical protein
VERRPMAASEHTFISQNKFRTQTFAAKCHILILEREEHSMAYELVHSDFYVFFSCSNEFLKYKRKHETIPLKPSKRLGRKFL